MLIRPYLAAFLTVLALAACSGGESDSIVASGPIPEDDPPPGAPSSLDDEELQALQRINSCNAPAGEVFTPPIEPERAQCGDYDPFRQAFFGDTHVHTAWSFDAYVNIPERDPDWAIRFAKGEDPGGEGQRLRQPLDFVMISDHSELVGEVLICTDPEVDPMGFNSPECRAFRDELPIPNLPFFGGQASFGALLFALGIGQPVTGRLPFCLYADCEAAAQSFWEELIRINNAHNEACGFTTLHGYEWTYSPNAAQTHRNIMFENNNVPERPISYFDARSSSDLARQLQNECREEDGCRFLSIPHNSNISRGRQFFIDPLRLFVNDPIYIDELGEIARVNKVVEIMQVKGNSECRLGLGTTDEECDFELINAHRPLCCDPIQGVTENCVNALEAPNCTPVCPADRPSDAVVETGVASGCQATHDFVRNAYKTALGAQRQLGFNPLKLGIIGSTDTHSAIPGAADEDLLFVREDAIDSTAADLTRNPGALAGVWAEENTRESIFAAFSRRETFGTSGPRIRIRMWAGDFPDGVCDLPSEELRRTAYRLGTPMGQDVTPAQIGDAPEFLIQAQMDEIPLDRLQMIKVWADEAGSKHERVFELNPDPGPGAAVDAQCRVQITDSRDNNPQLCRQWTDPEFDPDIDAVYYARVLQEQSCRWSAHVCTALRADPQFCEQNPGHNCCPGGSFAENELVQERAWTSPIWYANTCARDVATDFPVEPALPAPVGR